MKKFLSLVLALVMTMSLVTISAGAKEFADDDAITYDEAINVISTIGVVDGYEDGSFKPTTVLTRGAAAKIICNLILGPTTAAELHADTAPFSDVPTTNTFAGYIAYCAKEGIISGYADGTFKPGNTLTGYAFMKMLLGALGYDAEIEGYTGANWSIPVAKRALEVGLNKGLEGEFNGIKAVNREEACLYAFNALKADLVEYETSLSVNNAGNLTGLAIAKARVFQNSATRIEHIKDDHIIQFAEQYFPKLELKDDTDVFGRPANTWVFDKKEIGTYVDYTTLVAEYTKKVTGKTLYEEITKSVLDDSTINIYVDGEVEESILDKAYFTRNQIAKSYDEKVGKTGNGVLTQVFIDTDADEVDIVIINTYLAKAAEDYDEKNDEVDLDVYSIENLRSSSKTAIYMKASDEKTTITVDGEDFNVEEVEEDDLFLVTVADGEIQSMDKPEIVSEATITNFKLEKYVTADGTQYDYADTVMYDEEVLYNYDDKNMKEVTYNVILDPYGYMIGIELNEEPDQYVFLTGIDLGSSNLSKKNADANIIFTDGTMETVTVNMTDSEMTYTKNNIKGALVTATDKLANLKVDLDSNHETRAQLNTWCTYTVDKNGVYTLKQVAPTTIEKDKTNGVSAVKVAQAVQNVTGSDVTIDKKNVSLDGAKTSPADNNPNGYTYDFEKVYGNDDTIYLNIDEDDLENIEDKNDNLIKIINDVSSVTTGVKNVKLTVKNILDDTYKAPVNEIYTLYKDNGYIIAAVVIGEDDGISSNYAYVTSEKVEQEAYDSSADEYTWIREVVINGKVVELREVGDHLKYLKTMAQGEWYEVKYDAKGNVRNVIGPIDFQGTPAQNGSSVAYDKFAYTVQELDEAVLSGSISKTVKENFDTVVLADTTTVTDLTYKAGTLYTNTDATKGFAVAANVNVVLILADEDGDPFDDVDDSYTNYTGLEKALRNLNSNSDPFDVEVHAILESGIANSIILNDRAPAPSGADDATTPSVRVTVSNSTATDGDTVTFTASVSNAADCGTLTYQWYKDTGNYKADSGEEIAGATEKTYTISSAVTGDTGTYICKVTNTDTSSKITGKTKVSDEDYVALNVDPKDPETMDVLVTVEDSDGTKLSENIMEVKAEPGKQYAIIGGNTNPVEINDKVVTQPAIVNPFVAGGYGTATVTVADTYEVKVAVDHSVTDPGVFDVQVSGEGTYVKGSTVTVKITITRNDAYTTFREHFVAAVNGNAEDSSANGAPAPVELTVSIPSISDDTKIDLTYIA